MKTIDPYLLFNGNCRQAMEFYAECLGADLFKMTYGEGPGVQPDAIKDKIMHSKITKGDLVIMASDPHDATPVNQGNSYFLHLNCDSAEEIERLFAVTKAELSKWVGILHQNSGTKFPEKVTAFRPEMAVHGKYKQPCPRCGTKIQRIRYAANETNYCPTCQTGGKLLADRSLSRLLREDWPKTLDELESIKTNPRDASGKT